jgi:hypothetical protein
LKKLRVGFVSTVRVVWEEEEEELESVLVVRRLVVGNLMLLSMGGLSALVITLTHVGAQCEVNVEAVNLGNFISEL